MNDVSLFFDKFYRIFLLLNKVFSYLKKESTYNSEEYCNCLIVKMGYIQVWAFLRLQTISMTTQSLPFESLGTGCKLPTQTYFFGLVKQLGGGRWRDQPMSA